MKRALFLLWIMLAAGARAQSPPAADASPTPMVASPAPVAGASTPAPGVDTSSLTGPVNLALHLDKARVELGQSLRLTLDLRYPGNLSLTPPPADKFDFKPFDMQDARSSRMPPEGPPSRGAAGGVIQGSPGSNATVEHLRYSFKIAPFDTGTVKIPNLEIPFTLNGKEQKVVVAGPSVEVARVTPGKDDKPDEIRDLKALETAPFPPALLVALIVIGLLLVYLLVRWVRWLRRPKLKPAVPAMAPYPWALQELSRLEKERPDQDGRFEELYDRLTMILRVYLGWRYRRSLLEQTTSETLASLGIPMGREGIPGNHLSEDNWRDLRAVLEQADLAKFAALSPESGRIQQHLELARQLIEKNAPFDESAAANGTPAATAAGGSK